MPSSKLWIPLVACLVLWPGSAVAQEGTHVMTESHTLGFRKIEQPLALKLAVTLAGLGLIAAELHWFLNPKLVVQKATVSAGSIQELTIEVQGGYQPNYVVIQAHQPVKLSFHRTDPSACLERVVLPDFGITLDLPLGQVVSAEFTPDTVGLFEFVCGMNMVHGRIEVQG